MYSCMLTLIYMYGMYCSKAASHSLEIFLSCESMSSGLICSQYLVTEVAGDACAIAYSCADKIILLGYPRTLTFLTHKIKPMAVI